MIKNRYVGVFYIPILLYIEKIYNYKKRRKYGKNRFK